MNHETDALTWSAARLARAIEAIAAISGMESHTAQSPNESETHSVPPDVVQNWIHGIGPS